MSSTLRAPVILEWGMVERTRAARRAARGARRAQTSAVAPLRAPRQQHCDQFSCYSTPKFLSRVRVFGISFARATAILAIRLAVRAAGGKINEVNIYVYFIDGPVNEVNTYVYFIGGGRQ